MSQKMVVLGDSVHWGQGLADTQKFHERLRLHLGVASSDCLQLAHSGAILDSPFDTPPRVPSGEVPKFYPTVTEQARTAAAASAWADASFVLVNGGINDVDARFIVSPFTDRRRLVQKTQKHCHLGLAALLQLVLQGFPGAAVIVTGYYPILSDQSHLPLFADFLVALGVPVDPALRLLEKTFTPELASRFLFEKIVTNCRIFAEESAVAIRRAVADADDGSGRLKAALVPFDPENAALAPQAWLFGITPDILLSPEDPVAGQRHEACILYENDVFQREQCFRASAGHPNPLGAQQFVNAIVAAL